MVTLEKFSEKMEDAEKKIGDKPFDPKDYGKKEMKMEEKWR